MCIYCNTKHYRKIYQNHFGAIPKEPDGQSYDIHHIDGDHSNNNPLNLKAITVQEHYNIHYNQGDYGACMLIKQQRLMLTPEERSDLSRKIQFQRVNNGTHPFQTKANGTNLQITRVNNGTHPFLKRDDGSSISSDRVLNGTHNWLDGKNQSAYQQELIKNKTHNFQKLNFISSSQIYLSCLCCKKITNLRGFNQGHLNKCYKSIPV